MEKDCNTCIYNKDIHKPSFSVCLICKQTDKIQGTYHDKYLPIISKPKCCGECEYKRDSVHNIFIRQDPYCDASGEVSEEDNRIAKKYIRKNYLAKNTPKWCPLLKNINI